MKNALILLAVVALVVVTLGAFNREASLDVDYVVGVWRSVSVFWLFLIAAGVVLAAGLLGAVIARAQGWRERSKLEKELLDVYRRLRSAEAEAARVAGAAGAAAAAAEAQTMAAAQGAGPGATVADLPTGETTALSSPDAKTTVVSEPPEASTVVSEPPEAFTAASAPDEATVISAPDEAATAVSAPGEDAPAAPEGAEGARTAGDDGGRDRA